MTNFEKYAQYLKDKDIYNFAVRNGKPDNCSGKSCDDCRFRYNSTCGQGRMSWLMEEYKEPEIEIDWEKVPVDTPVYVRDYDTGNWHPRYFNCFTPDNIHKFKVFSDGRSSFTVSELDGDKGQVLGWKFCKLAREEDIEKYRKK